MGGAPSKPDMTKRLQVISTGYSKTGTASMQLAIQRLIGGPVMHGGTHILAGNDEVMHVWLQAWQARKAGDRARCLMLLGLVTKGFTALVDMPVVAFLPELAELYPDAKFIIVSRDPDAWWESMEEHLRKALPWWMPYLTPIAPTLRWYPGFVRIWQADVDAMVGGREHWGPRILELHNEEARGLVPPDQRLEYALGDGWGPLADFLGRPVPDEPFPHVNEAAEGAKVVARILGGLMLRWTVLLGVVGSGAYVGIRYLRGPRF